MTKAVSERIEKGQILGTVIIEMLGAPKEHIEQTMKDYVVKLKEDKNIEIVRDVISDTKEQTEEDNEDAKKHKQSLFALYVELDIWFKDADKLFAFCFDSLPSSVEIVEPQNFKFSAPAFTVMLNDLQAKLHMLDYSLKDHISARQVVGKQIVTIMENFIAYCRETGKDSPEDISKITGIGVEQIKKILEQIDSDTTKKDNT